MPTEKFQFSESERRRVGELLSALRTPVEVTIHPDSWLMNETFAAEFQSRLLSQHVFLKSILAEKSFEAAFVASASVAGMTTVPAISGQRFWDVEIAGRKISLKSTKAKSLKLKELHISKLTEAAWIQDCRTARMRMEKVHDLFRLYVATVSSIIQLRYFQNTNSYELVEVPVSLLSQVMDLTVNEFASENSTIDIPVGKSPPDFTLKLDRSDAKITLAKISKECCIVHATWKLPLDKPAVQLKPGS